MFKFTCSERDLATILAALNLWRDRDEFYSGGRSGALLEVATNGGEFQELTGGGVDALIGKLNEPPKAQRTAHCEKCGSEDIEGVSWGCTYDKETGNWIIGDSVDNIRCNVCDEERAVEWRDAEPEKPQPFSDEEIAAMLERLAKGEQIDLSLSKGIVRSSKDATGQIHADGKLFQVSVWHAISDAWSEFTPAAFEEVLRGKRDIWAGDLPDEEYDAIYACCINESCFLHLADVLVEDVKAALCPQCGGDLEEAGTTAKGDTVSDDEEEVCDHSDGRECEAMGHSQPEDTPALDMTQYIGHPSNR